jgi:hypothetical protein
MVVQRVEWIPAWKNSAAQQNGTECDKDSGGLKAHADQDESSDEARLKLQRFVKYGRRVRIRRSIQPLLHDENVLTIWFRKSHGRHCVSFSLNPIL